MDYTLFTMINNFASNIEVVDYLAIFTAEWLIFALIISVFLIKPHLKVIRQALTSIVITYGVNYLIGLIYFRKRPFVDHAVNLLVNHEPDKSFPSDHTAVSFTIATSIFLYNKKLGLIAYILASLIGFSRVFCGLHYPGDVVMGIFVGVLVALITYYIFKKYLNKNR